MEFPLVDCRTLMGVEELDGVLDSDDVACSLVVDLVHKSSQRGRFAAARRPGYQDDARPELGCLGKLTRQVQRLEIGDVSCDHAHNDGAAPALGENVHPKARNLWQTVRNIARPFLLELVNSMRVAPNQISGNAGCILRIQESDAGNFQLNQLAVGFYLRGTARGKNQVADLWRGAKHRRDD